MSFASDLKKLAKDENEKAIRTKVFDWIPNKPELETKGMYTMSRFTKCRKEAMTLNPTTKVEEIDNDRMMASVIFYMCHLKEGGKLFKDVNEAVGILSSLETTKVLELFNFAQGVDEDPLVVGNKQE